VQELVVYLLSNVPGLPPIVQTVHLLGIAVIMSSVVLLDLRILGLALPSQDVQELTRRVMPWVWWTLPVMLLSGSMFVFARPRRYFTNPVFGLKFALLLPAIALAAVLHFVSVRKPDDWRTKLVAALSLLLWVGVVLAGRWIAYADYLFPEE
jgi:cytochrome bd-type quinol oxidase subunit 2